MADNPDHNPLMNIEIIALDRDGYEDMRRDFNTMKEARAFLKTTAIDPAFWDRRAEFEGYHRNIRTIQLHKDGECVADVLPEWGARTVERWNGNNWQPITPPPPFVEDEIADGTACTGCWQGPDGADYRWD